MVLYVTLNYSTVTNVAGNSQEININEAEDIQPENEENYIIQHEELSEEGETERQQNLDNAHRPNKRKRSSQSEERLQLLKQIAQRNETSIRNQLDETDHFFMSMAKIVKKLPRYEQAQLRMKISTLVGNAELQYLSREYIDQTSRATSSCHSDVLEDMLSPASTASPTLSNDQRQLTETILLLNENAHLI